MASSVVIIHYVTFKTKIQILKIQFWNLKMFEVFVQTLVYVTMCLWSGDRTKTCKEKKTNQGPSLSP